jgi:hypothetical protein
VVSEDREERLLVGEQVGGGDAERLERGGKGRVGGRDDDDLGGQVADVLLAGGLERGEEGLRGRGGGPG